MPWEVRKRGSWWEIVKPGQGKVVGRSTTKSKAEASVRARYAGARAGGEKLSEHTISMHDLEHICATVVELNELAEAGWKVQTIILHKVKYRTREQVLTKVKEMGFNAENVNETGDEDTGSWRIRQLSASDFSEFKSQIVNDYITLVHGKTK